MDDKPGRSRARGQSNKGSCERYDARCAPASKAYRQAADSMSAGASHTGMVTRKGSWLFVLICLKYQALYAFVPNKASTNQIIMLVFCW
jgi:hypothetical protein